VSVDGVDGAGLLAAARADLTAGLDGVLGDRLRSSGGGAGGRPRRVLVRDIDVPGRCPARFAHPEDSVWGDLTTTTATRTLGRLVLRRWEGVGPPARALDDLLARPDELPDWLADGLEPLDPAALAAIRASVLAWVADARTPVRSRTDLVWDGPGGPVDVPGRALRLTARWDARLGPRRSPTTLLVHSPRAADPEVDRLLAGFVALVGCFWSEAVAERVRFSTAGTGTTRAVAVTADVLGAAIERVVELVGHAVEPESAPALAGTWCRWCHRLQDCAVGRGHLGQVHDPPG